jgi:hypothetical protein
MIAPLSDTGATRLGHLHHPLGKAVGLPFIRVLGPRLVAMRRQGLLKGGQRA